MLDESRRRIDVERGRWRRRPQSRVRHGAPTVHSRLGLLSLLGRRRRRRRLVRVRV